MKKLIPYILSIFLFMYCGGNSSNTTTATAESEYAVQIVNDGGLVKKAVKERAGKVVLVNFWATWCEPCVAEFPALVKLGKKYRDQGLEVITISYDWEDDIDSKVVPFLEKHEADFTHFLQGLEAVDQDFLLDIDKGLKGNLPSTLVYDREGNRRHLIAGELDPDDLESKIKALIEQ